MSEELIGAESKSEDDEESIWCSVAKNKVVSLSVISQFVGQPEIAEKEMMLGVAGLLPPRDNYGTLSISDAVLYKVATILGFNVPCVAPFVATIVRQLEGHITKEVVAIVSSVVAGANENEGVEYQAVVIVDEDRAVVVVPGNGRAYSMETFEWVKAPLERPPHYVFSISLHEIVKELLSLLC